MTSRRTPRPLPAPGHVARALALAVLGVACGDATAPLPADGAPREFAARVSGMAGVVYDVRLVGDTVVLASTAFGPNANPPVTTVTRRVPSADDWRAFWRTLNDIGVRRWPDVCQNNSVTEGGTFTYTLVWSDGRRTGTYYAAYPTRAGACSNDSGGDAAAFEHAVYALAGVAFVQALRTP